jgi:cytochrome c-type biogenesis protein CcmF
MRLVGEACLLAAFVAAGFAAFACCWGSALRDRRVLRAGFAAALAGLVTLSGCVTVLVAALVAKDFSFDYVAKYSSQLLPWHYSLSALWVGQAGSLLLWAWLTLAFALAFRVGWQRTSPPLRDFAFGLAMGYVCFLAAIMVFAADPMKASVVATEEGAGLNPLLQHPAMMIHPPIVFAGYAAWTLPCALALAALVTGQLDERWVAAARPWAVAAWAILGGGILLGANWAYEELGWGGYWGWDPVENGSLIPWLTGTVLVHSLMVWRIRDGLKKTAVALAIVTFCLCNFATFLTRSGVFSSVHAFSHSPIGWMFLALMGALLVLGGGLTAYRRSELKSTMQIRSFWARETYVLVAAVAILLLAAVVFVGTLVVPVSTVAVGKPAVVGPEFYNAVLAPIGLVLLATTAAVPLLRWGGAPHPAQRKLLAITLAIGVIAGIVAAAVGLRRPEALAVTMLAVAAPVAILLAIFHDASRQATGVLAGIVKTLLLRRTTYAGYAIHLGFVAVAIGVAGTSLGSQRRHADMNEGDSIQWNDREIRYAQLERTELQDKLVVSAQLEVQSSSGNRCVLRPARHYHFLQEQWTTEVDICSAWSGDFYAILNGGQGETTASLTFVEMPLIRFLWIGGVVCCLGAAAALWPQRRRSQQRALPIAEDWQVRFEALPVRRAA